MEQRDLEDLLSLVSDFADDLSDYAMDAIDQGDQEIEYVIANVEGELFEITKTLRSRLKDL